MHCLSGKLLLHYKPRRNAAKLRASCLAEVTVSYIFRGLLCKTFPLGCITFGGIKNLCLSAGQASRAHAPTPAPCFAWISYKYRAYSRNRSQERKRPGLQTGHTVSNAIAICKRGKEQGRRKGSLLTRERKVGPFRIIRWEFKGAPNLQCNQASGPRSILTHHFFILSSPSERWLVLFHAASGMHSDFFPPY